MDGNNSTSIKYSDVRSGISVLRDDCLPKMKNIFSDFNSSMNRLGGQDVFVGDASESFQARYSRLSRRFSDFEELVKKFAHEFEMASSSTSQTEQALEQEAQNLNDGN